MAWTQQAEDQFSGTTGTSLASHTPDQGSGWTLDAGTWTLTGSNSLDANTSSNATARNGTTLADKQAAQFTMKNSGVFGILLRASAGPSGYVLFNFVNTLQFYRLDSGSYTQLVGSTGATSPGDVLRFEADGTGLTGYINGVSTITTTDGTYTSGTSGLHANTQGLGTFEYYSAFFAYDEAVSTGQPTMRRWGGTPYLGGGQGIGQKGGGGGRAWGRRKSGIFVPQRFQEAA